MPDRVVLSQVGGPLHQQIRVLPTRPQQGHGVQVPVKCLLRHPTATGALLLVHNEHAGPGIMSMLVQPGVIQQLAHFHSNPM